MEHGEGSQSGCKNPRSNSAQPSRQQQQHHAALAAAAPINHPYYVPLANITRIMRRVLPPQAKIADDAKETMQQCVSEYINLITGEANERCHREKRKTINGDDVLCAMDLLGFDNYVEPLKLFLSRYRDAQKERNSEVRGTGGAVVRSTVQFGRFPPQVYGLPPGFPVVVQPEAAANVMDFGYYGGNGGGGGGGGGGIGSSSYGHGVGPSSGSNAQFK